MLWLINVCIQYIYSIIQYLSIIISAHGYMDLKADNLCFNISKTSKTSFSKNNK